MENKVISLEELYAQIQEMMDRAGIGTYTLKVEGIIAAYEHEKQEKYVPYKGPEKKMTVYISHDYRTVSQAAHTSIEALLAMIKGDIAKEVSKEKAEDITIQTEQ